MSVTTLYNCKGASAGGGAEAAGAGVGAVWRLRGMDGNKFVANHLSRWLSVQRSITCDYKRLMKLPLFSELGHKWCSCGSPCGARQVFFITIITEQYFQSYLLSCQIPGSRWVLNTACITTLFSSIVKWII